MNKFLLYLSNALILIGLGFVLYYVFYLEPNRNKLIESKFNTIQQLSASIILYKNEPETVRILAQDIIKTTTEFQDIKRKDIHK